MRDVNLIKLPTIITTIGKYVTRRGEIVTIDLVEKIWGVVPQCGLGRYPNHTTGRWDISGRISGGFETENDIVSKLVPESAEEKSRRRKREVLAAFGNRRDVGLCGH